MAFVDTATSWDEVAKSERIRTKLFNLLMNTLYDTCKHKYEMLLNSVNIKIQFLYPLYGILVR